MSQRKRLRRERITDQLYDEPRLDVSHGPILYLESISVSFDGFKALNNLTLYIDAGELRCIIGPNGAGKTTLLDVITGKTRPDSGTAYYGQTINLLELKESQIARSGIGRKFQKPTIFPAHTVFENLELATGTDKGVWSCLRETRNLKEEELVQSTLEIIGLTHVWKNFAGALSHGQKQWLEIGMLLVQDAELLLVDEPVAGMTHEETERTAELLTSLAGDRSVVVVEHDMEFVRSIANKVTVLHEGSVLAEGDMASVQSDPRVIEVYLGA